MLSTNSIALPGGLADILVVPVVPKVVETEGAIQVIPLAEVLSTLQRVAVCPGLWGKVEEGAQEVALAAAVATTEVRVCCDFVSFLVNPGKII